MIDETKELYGTVGMKFEVSKYDILGKAREIIKEVFELRNVTGIENGRMHEGVEYATSHSWIKKEDRGIPNKKQKAALEALEVLQEAKKLLR